MTSTTLSTSSIGRQQSTRAGKKRTKPWLAADFETTTDEDDCRVWAWGVARVDNPEDVIIDTTLESFIDFISMESSVTYFHNLRFDGMFILDHILNSYLIMNGFEFVTGRGNPKPGQFKVLISEQNKFYSITVGWLNGTIVEFRDSAKKFPGMSIAKIAKSFKLEETKGKINYDAHNGPVKPITPEEKSYLESDVMILARALATVQDTGATRLTVASDAKAEYIALTGEALYDVRFPVLSYALDAELRKAYRGGFTIAMPRWARRRVGRGVVLDVNSLYPFIMCNRLMPYGEPEFVYGEVETTKQRPLAIFAITFTATLKPDHIPCIQVKGTSMYTPTEYLSEITEPTTLMMTNVDLALYEEHYDMDILEYHYGWRFKAKMGMFDEYMNKWASIKAVSEGGTRELAKLYMNSLYGIFGRNPNMRGKIPTLIDGKVKLVAGEPEIRDSVYVPIAVFVTSFGRDFTIRSAQANYDTFAYADTDSLHLMYSDEWMGSYTDEKTKNEYKVPEGLDIHSSRMGGWKVEYEFDEAMYVRAKVYLEHLPNVQPFCDDPECDKRHDFHNAFAGLPDKVSGSLTFDDVWNGNKFGGKLVPKIVPGGVVLEDSSYTLIM